MAANTLPIPPLPSQTVAVTGDNGLASKNYFEYFSKLNRTLSSPMLLQRTSEINAVLDYNADNEGGETADEIQDTINAAAEEGKTAYFPAGTYRHDTQISYSTDETYGQGLHIKGAGKRATMLDSRVANDFGWVINGHGGSTDHHFMHGGSITDLAFISGGGAGTKGVQTRALWHWTFLRVRLEGFASDGWQCLSSISPGDPDGSAYLHWDQCEIFTVGGKAFEATTSANGAVGLTQSKMTHTKISGCDRAMVLDGVFNWEFSNNFFGGWTTDGVTVEYNNTGNQQLWFLWNEFGNADDGHCVWMKDCYGGGILGNLVTGLAGEGITHGFIISEAAGSSRVRHVKAYANRFRVESAVTPFTAWDIRAGAQYFKPEGNIWLLFDDGGAHTAYASGNTGARVRQTTAGSAAPDLTKGPTQHIVFNGTTGTALTLDAPVAAEAEDIADGERIRLIIENAIGGGGAISAINFNGVYRVQAPTPPADGTLITTELEYNATLADWLQIGGWTGDI